ncbi:MAG: flagellar motor protein MotB [bacterium]|nr:flagellar motor protein MotB [bacterium]
MRKRRKKPQDNENLERWLLTYADLITLLLAFFIVMYSMSRVDAKKFGQMTQALNGILNGGDEIFGKELENDPAAGHGLLKLGNLKMLQSKITDKFKKLQRHEVETEITERGLVIHIMESALFKEGAAKLEPKAMEILDIVYEDIQDKPNHVRVEGHTDDKSIQTAVFPSNWELSTARATEVVRYFTDNYGYPSDKISALGYGQYRPVRPNNSIEHRAMNRRVDIVVLTMELSLKEPTSQLYAQDHDQ